MIAGEISCDEAEVLLPLVADGALDVDSDPALFAHLARCVTCQESLTCHDLVALSLTRNALRPPLRLKRRRVPLPWALSSLAALVMASVFGFIYLNGVVAQERISSRLAALRVHSAPVAETQVINLGGDDPRHPAYIMMQDGHAIVVHPQLDEQHGADTSLLHAVGLNRY